MTAESVQMLVALVLGFAFAGLCSSGYRLCTSRLPSFSQLSAGPQPGDTRRDPAPGRRGAVPDHAQHHFGPPAQGASLRIRFPGDADRRLLEPYVRPGPRDDLAGLRSPARLKTFLPRSVEASSRALGGVNGDLQA